MHAFRGTRLVSLGAGLLAVAGVLLLGGHSPTQADSQFNNPTGFTYCGNLEYDFPPSKMRVDLDLAGPNINGTATDGDATTLTDSGASFPDLSGKDIYIWEGAGEGQAKTILSNTGEVITITGIWNPEAAASSKYVVELGDCVTVVGENLANNAAADLTSDFLIEGPTKGTATAGTNATTIEDTARPDPFVVDALIGYTVKLYGVTAASGQASTIIDNDATTMTVSPAFSPAPTTDQPYILNDGSPSLEGGFPVSLRPNGVQINVTGDGGADGLGADIPVGEKVGGGRGKMTLGVANNICVPVADVDMILYNVALPNNPSDPRASTNIAWPRPQGQKARFDRWIVGDGNTSPWPDPFSILDGTGPADADVDLMADSDSLAIQNYPSYLLDLFDPDFAPGGSDGPLKPVVPIAVYGGLTIPFPYSGEWQAMYFVQFASGAFTAAGGFTGNDHPYSRLDASQGQPNATVLNDPTAFEGTVNSISDFCSPLDVRVMLLGTTPTTLATRAKNPAGPAATHFGGSYTISLRDLDQDGWDSSRDPCPVNADTGNDGDGDALDFACDPNDTVGEGINNMDFDSDGFVNGQDNCPQVANGNEVSGDPGGDRQAESEFTVSWDAAAPDGGPYTDDMGDACEGPGGYGDVAITQNGVPMTITTSDAVANGRYHINADVHATCFGGTDADGDGYCAEDMETGFDGNATRHNAWPASLTGDSSTSLDTDEGGADLIPGGLPEGGFDSDWLEDYLGTDPTRPCADTVGTLNADDETVDNWMFDMNDDGKAALGDVLQYIGKISTQATTQALKRFDLNVDGMLGLGDALKFISVFNKNCAPVTPQQ